VFSVPDDDRLSLDLSKNIVVHFFVSRAMVATALGKGDAASPMDALRDRVASLSRLFKYEFQFRADAPFDQIFDETIDAMVKDGELAIARVPAPFVRVTGAERVTLYRRIVQNF